MTERYRGPALRRRGGCLLLAAALVVGACSGSDEAAQADDRSDAATVQAAHRAPDPANCPIDALDQSDGRVEIRVWHGLAGLAATALEELAEEYNASQERVLVRVDAQGDYEELFAKYREASRVGGADLPDVLLAQDTDTRFLVDSGTVVAADDCIAADPGTAEHYETLADFVRAAYTVDGLLWPAVYGVASPVLYFNRAHLGQAGLDPDDPPENLDELREAAEAIKAVRPEGHPLAFRAHSWWIENLSTGQKDALVDQDNGRAGLARRSQLRNDTIEEVLEWMRAMVEDGLMTVYAHSQVAEAPMSVIRPAADNSSMLIDTSSAVTTLDALLGGELGGEEVGLDDREGAERVDIGVGELPGLREAGSGQVAGNAWYLVDGGEPVRVAAAWDFLRWVIETPQQVKWTMQGSYLPVWEGAVEDPELQRYFADTRPGRWLEVARRSLEGIDPDFPGPLVGPYVELRESLRVALERVLIEGRSVEQGLAAADASFQSALDDYAREVSD